jgi:hypothetical protein
MIARRLAHPTAHVVRRGRSVPLQRTIQLAGALAPPLRAEPWNVPVDRVMTLRPTESAFRRPLGTSRNPRTEQADQVLP